MANKKTKEDFAKELVRIGWEDDPASFKRVPRIRLSKETLDRVFECDVHYLKDQVGTVLFPEQWQSECLPAPIRYFVVEKEKKVREPDAASDPAYTGSTTCVVRNVVLGITSEEIELWVRKGLEQEDKVLQSSLKKFNETKEQIAKNNEKLDRIPFMATKSTTVADAAFERKAIQRRVEAEIEELTKTLAADQEVVDAEYRRKADEYVKCELLYNDEALNRSTFRVSFRHPRDHDVHAQDLKDEAQDSQSGVEHQQLGAKSRRMMQLAMAKMNADEAEEVVKREQRKERIKAWNQAGVLEDQFINKESWDDVHLIPGNDDDNIPPLAFLGEVPAEYVMFESNLRGASVARVRHGSGCLVYADGSTYNGEWFAGEPQGKGKLYTNKGTFSGNFKAGRLCGTECVIKYANGDSYEGQVGYTASLQQQVQPLLNTELFHFGTPHGRGVFRFASGSVYEGEFKCGRITGLGIYKCVTGEEMKGKFENGVLGSQPEWTWDYAGKKPNRIPTWLTTAYNPESQCYHRTEKGDEYRGLFLRGLAHEQATFLDKNKSRYEGEWNHGMFHGMGEMKFANGNRYHGYFESGLRAGRGILSYGNVKPAFDKETGKTFLECDHTFEGKWLAGSIRSRGLVINNNISKGNSMSTHYFTTNTKSASYPFLNTLQQSEDKRQRRRQRMYKRLRSEFFEMRTKVETHQLVKFNRGRNAAIEAYTQLKRRIQAEQDAAGYRIMAGAAATMEPNNPDGAESSEEEDSDSQESDNDHEDEEGNHQDEELEDEEEEVVADQDHESKEEVEPGSLADTLLEKHRKLNELNNGAFQPSFTMTLAEMLDDPPPKDLKAYSGSSTVKSNSGSVSSNPQLDYYLATRQKQMTLK